MDRATAANPPSRRHAPRGRHSPSVSARGPVLPPPPPSPPLPPTTEHRLHCRAREVSSWYLSMPVPSITRLSNTSATSSTRSHSPTPSSRGQQRVATPFANENHSPPPPLPSPTGTATATILNADGAHHARLCAYIIEAVNRPSSLWSIARAVQPRVALALWAWARRSTVTAAVETKKVTFENICKMFVGMDPSPLTEEMDAWFVGLLGGLRAFPLNLPGTAFR